MKKLIAFCPCVLLSFLSLAQDVFLLEDPGNSLVVLDEGWTYQMGDHPEASRIDYDGHAWKPIHPNADIVESIPAEVKTGIGWMRFRFIVSGDAQKQELAPTVSITTTKSKNGILISVKDNGNGIPVSIKEKIFQPFFTTKPAGQGTGLGLSLSYDIVKAHRGELKMETKEGEGAEFITELFV